VHREADVNDSTTLTIRLSAKTKEQLAELAERTRRTRSFLAAEAITDFVEHELGILEKIERGRADVRAGRVTPHDDVTGEAHAIIEAARTRR
jgi:predicted transcriptional regulator